MTIRMTKDEYLMHRDEYNGVCRHCHEIEWGGVEPDAEGYKCESCGLDAVDGIGLLMISGEIEITEIK